MMGPPARPPQRVEGGPREFCAPQKILRTPQDVGRFESSEVYGKLTQLVEGMQAAAVGKRLSDECAVSPLVGRALGMLEVR